MGLKRTMRLLNVLADLDSGYEEANETAIELLSAAGYEPDHLDRLREPITDATQSLLIDAFLRAPGAERLVQDMLSERRLRTSVGKPLQTTGEPIMPSLPLRAFNLFEGAAFVEDDLRGTIKVWVVMAFQDLGGTVGAEEKVLLACRRADLAEDADTGVFVKDYNDTVNLVGHVRNAHDFDDNDWGN